MLRLLGHVGRRLDAILGELRHRNFEALLDLLHHLFILGGADKRDTETLGTETTGTTDTMQVRIGVLWKIVVDSQIDLLDIDTTSKDVSSDTYTLVEVLELLVSLDTTRSKHLQVSLDVIVNIPLFLADSRVNCNTGEVAFAEQLVEFGGTDCVLDEDNDLVELELVKKVV